MQAKKRKLYKNADQTPSNSAGFTLMELMVVISIITLLSSIMPATINEARQKARRAVALVNQRQLQKAIEMYYNDMGFYPPDVNRGWDPGIAKPLPSNKDLGYDCNINPAPCTCPSSVFPTCDQTPFPLPADWKTQAQAKWGGPYVSVWPNTAPWGGKYDFNNWRATTTRYGFDVAAGIYIGTQRNYDDSNPIPPLQEQWFLDLGMDADYHLNGESQLILMRY